MIDRVATLEEVLKKLGAKDVGMSGRPMRAFGTAGAAQRTSASWPRSTAFRTTCSTR
jgi:hypothetical protein